MPNNIKFKSKNHKFRIFQGALDELQIDVHEKKQIYNLVIGLIKLLNYYITSTLHHIVVQRRFH